MEMINRCMLEDLSMLHNLLQASSQHRQWQALPIDALKAENEKLKSVLAGTERLFTLLATPMPEEEIFPESDHTH
ncbi:hypothetical protein [Chitinophaga sp. Cy-1792]|uniref:hypothetical protein n=1 Tax=Chitinophaga sp. Cy-1792 TaxID=2608339 RepID=UPI00141F7142|nr:hypothetical protein [Chitinophaga sp. Cy-1792]NIG56977.1 hypothetical protein [Chitinophaga sp. Cy-1792]